MKTEVIIPWLGGDPDRERNLRWVLDRLDYPVTIAPGGEPWSKGRCLYGPILACEEEIVVILDADCHLVGGLSQAVNAVAATGGPAWGVPHRNLHRLSQDGTARLLAGADWRGLPLDQPCYEGTLGGGAVVARREVLLDVPMDPRFVGWGQEDLSYGIALHTLHGAPWRGEADLIHFWHPPQPRMSRRVGSQEGHDLHWRYLQARDDPVAMRELVAETHAAPEDRMLTNG